MKRIESQTDKLAHRFRDFVLPGWAQVVFFVLLGAIVLVVYNTSTVISRLDNNYLRVAKTLKASMVTLFDSFSGSFSPALGGRLGQIILWAFIGAAAYVCLWLVKNILNSFENDIIASGYLHPSSLRGFSYWESSLSVKVFLLAAVLFTASYAYIILKVALPAVATLAASATYNFHSLSWLYILFSVLLAAVLLYILELLLRFIPRLWKLL